MGGWPLLAASMAGHCPGQAAAICSTSQAGWAVRAGSCASTRARSDARSATNRRSTALASPVARCAPSSLTASTAACTVASATLREYSIWWAATVSSARMGLATPDGCLSSPSTTGARRKYQRSVPSAMARTAARSGAFAREARAASAERPHLITSSTARAAAASAGAPGAQGVLAKAPPGEGHTMRVIAYGHRPAPRPLHLRHTQTPPTASYAHEVTVYGDDRTRMITFIVFFWLDRRRLRLRLQDPQRLTVQRGFSHRPGIEGPDLALDLEGVAAPVDPCLGLPDLGRVRDTLEWLRADPERAGSQSLERLHKRRRAEARERGVERTAGVARGNGEPPLQQYGACVQTRVHLHDRDAGFGVAGEQGSLDGCRSAPARQQGRVNVDAPQGRQNQDLAWHDQAIGHDDQNLRSPGLELCARGGAAESLRLCQRQLRGKRCEFLAAPPGSVRLRQDPDDAVLSEQRREGWQREFRRAGKGDAQHYQPVGLADPKPWQ